MRGVGKVFIRPLQNRNAVSMFGVIVDTIKIVLITYAIAYLISALTHETITKKLNTVAHSILDAVQENRELNDGMQQHYKEDIDRTKWYIGDYEITYKTLDFSNPTPVSTPVGVSVNGANIPNQKFPKNTIFRVQIESKSETTLTKISKLLGSNSEAQVIGYAEGSVD